MAQTPPNWYADPHVAGQVRWWDGSQWTDHVQTAQVDPRTLPARSRIGGLVAPITLANAIAALGDLRGRHVNEINHVAGLPTSQTRFSGGWVYTWQATGSKAMRTRRYYRISLVVGHDLRVRNIASVEREGL